MPHRLPADLNLFRGIIPPLGGIDLSPILAFVVLDVSLPAAARLPACLQRRLLSTGGAGGLALSRRWLRARTAAPCLVVACARRPRAPANLP